MENYKFRFLILFTVVAVLSSILRFGQRENDNLSTLSDSDCYIDMAMVFSGEKEAFNPDWIRGLPHHYNRPFFPFVAGLIGHYLLGDDFKSAFSVINIIAAIVIAYILLIFLLKYYPDIRHPWIPSVLFLTAFSQMDFGYHILTETIGLAFALSACYFLYEFILRNEVNENKINNPGFHITDFYPGLIFLMVLQVLSFLTRETAWFVFIFFFYIILKRKLYKSGNLRLVLSVLIVLLLAMVPQSLYAMSFDTHIPGFGLDFSALFAPDYILDSVIKMALAFNIYWLLMIPALVYLGKKKLNGIHEFIIGWTLAAIGYMGAGYLHNSLMPNGYPLRMLFSMFPVIYILVVQYIEKRYLYPKHLYILITLIIIHSMISVAGVLADSGSVIVHTIYDAFRVIV